MPDPIQSQSTTAAPLLYSPREAETLLGVSHATLYRLIRARRTAASIERLLAELPTVAA
jgi:predicted DNA-binding transcriptional regulator AlpA